MSASSAARSPEELRAHVERRRQFRLGVLGYGHVFDVDQITADEEARLQGEADRG